MTVHIRKYGAAKQVHEVGDKKVCREESAAFPCEQCALRRHRIWYPVEEQK